MTQDSLAIYPTLAAELAIGPRDLLAYHAHTVAIISHSFFECVYYIRLFFYIV
jgi:hypothetical protein